MTVAELITIIIGVSSLITALSVIYAKFIKPVKKVVKQVEENTKSIACLNDKIVKINEARTEDNSFDVEVRAMLMESLIAVLDGLEQVGANSYVSDQKKKLISFLSHQVNGK